MQLDVMSETLPKTVPKGTVLSVTEREQLQGALVWDS